MSWQRFGTEWNPVLIVLAVLAVGVVLAMLHWWLGLAWMVACIAGIALAVWA